jgi:hypothetical protein
MFFVKSNVKRGLVFAVAGVFAAGVTASAIRTARTKTDGERQGWKLSDVRSRLSRVSADQDPADHS